MDYTGNLILAGDGGSRNAPRKRAEGFDPDELTRRLLIVQTEQKAFAHGKHSSTLASGSLPSRKTPNTLLSLRPRGRFQLRFGLWPRSNS